MDAKLTDWYPHNVQPARKGWYDRNWPTNLVTTSLDYWNGEAWFYGIGEGEIGGIAMLGRPWRGLAEDPNGGAA